MVRLNQKHHLLLSYRHWLVFSLESGYTISQLAERSAAEGHVAIAPCSRALLLLLLCTSPGGLNTLESLSPFAMVSFFAYCPSLQWEYSSIVYLHFHVLEYWSAMLCIAQWFWLSSFREWVLFVIFQVPAWVIVIHRQLCFWSSRKKKKKDWHDIWHDFCQDFSMPFAGIPSLMNTFYSSEMCNLMLCYLFSSLISKCQSSVGKLC